MVKIQDLAPVLMDKYGLGRDDAEQFISQMFDLVAEELNATQKSVKIKGLGTFKVTSVNSRESVDVNTGERIVISGRNKISFTPDVVMRDRVNRPFAQFETVVVNEGVDFSEIDKLTDAELLEQDVADDSCAPSSDDDGSSAGNEIEIVAPQASDEPLQEEVAEDAVEPSLKQVSCDSKEDVEAEMKSVEVKTEEGVEPQHVVSSKEEQSKLNPATPISHATQRSEAPYYNERKNDENKLSKHKCLIFCFVTAMLALVFCAAGFGIYYMYSLIRERNARIELLEKKVIQIQKASATAVKTKKKDFVPEQDNTQKDLQAVEVKNELGDSTKAMVKQMNAEEALPDIDYKSDPRLRTGAYIIIGVEKVVEVKKGQTLESISKTYLGNGMECYVEALNSRKEVAPGDKLKIPKLKWKKRKK